mmetsp:Transcript_4117/g.5691  ORF Transcript_4117/g.5691 Transcript_4117/m.5691 type:complete len:201 (+) Transcript_4117:577-1179(+)
MWRLAATLSKTTLSNVLMLASLLVALTRRLCLASGNIRSVLAPASTAATTCGCPATFSTACVRPTTSPFRSTQSRSLATGTAQDATPTFQQSQCAKRTALSKVSSCPLSNVSLRNTQSILLSTALATRSGLPGSMRPHRLKNFRMVLRTVARPCESRTKPRSTERATLKTVARHRTWIRMSSRQKYSRQRSSRLNLILLF